MAHTDALARYNAKRDFTRTAEPPGKPKRGRGGNLFMVQKHDARRLHFDFRLELDGVLKSWAITRGPSPDPADRRLAVRTEDHPLSYATFEGTIPAGEYGGGTVMLWDRGSWTPAAGQDPRKALEDGHVHFTLSGERRKGEWLLVRMKPRGREKGENWLLRKVEDDHAGAADSLVGPLVTSISSGRTMAEIAEGKPAPASPSRSGRQHRKGSPPAFRPVQLATLVDHVPDGAGWLHEVKYDGYRCLLAVGGGRARAWTRSGQDWSAKFPTIVAAGAALDVDSALIDGEIVAFDEEGRTGFSALQAAISAGGAGLVMVAFDLLSLDGESLEALPNLTRKQRLQALIGEGSDGLRYAEHVQGAGEKLFQALCDKGHEGVVSKRADAPYSGTRSQAWLKTKCIRRQEFIIIGWLASDKDRGFRSLLLATRQGDELRYAGKVGTGFDRAAMADLSGRLADLARKTAPARVPRAAARNVHWVRPTLVAEIAFAEFTADGMVRHASFLGLRADKPAAEVVAEKPVPVATFEGPPPSSVRISNAGRVIFPEDGLTKGDLADYYQQIAPLFLLAGARRPVSLVRCPQGRAKQCFFQKHDAGSFGPQVHQVPIAEKDGQVENYLWIDDADGLRACVQMGTIEFHGWGARVDTLEMPDRMIFDLDPDPGLGFDAVRQAAFDLRDHLADIGLVSFAMLSGGKGVHVLVPLTPAADWPAVTDFARRFCLALATAEPDRFTATMSKAKRKGRIFLDWLRNQRGSTAVLPYSARARPGAPVAAPVGWDELRAIDTPARYSIRDATTLVERAASSALSGWGEARQPLPDL